MVYKSYHETVAVLVDELPNFDKGEALRLIDYLNEHGFIAYAVDCRNILEEKSRSLRRRASTLILPQCECVPAELMASLANIIGRGTSLLFLGGPIFYDNIVNEDGKYVIKDFTEYRLDATFLPENEGFVLEGIAPAYKLYKAAADSFSPSEVFGAYDSLKTDSQLELFCPAHRNHGAGHFERRERFIPLVNATGTHNAAAYFMLTNQAYGGHDALGQRPGDVIPTTFSHAYGAIGIRRADILSLEGAGELILKMLWRLSRGIWIFEAGIDRLRPKHGERVRLGGVVMNSSLDYRTVEVEFRVGDLVKHRETVIAIPRGFTKFECELAVDELCTSDFELVCSLKADGKILDELTQEVAFKAPVKGGEAEFVRVKDGRFTLGDKPWQAVGMNYWPSYHPSLEIVDYWRGFLNTECYDPKIIERDLTKMEEIGINCLLTRLDTLDLRLYKEPLSDFIERMRAHGMKLMLSIPMLESPTHYFPDAFRQFIRENDLADEPVVFAHDVTWEVGSHFISGFRDNYTEEWDAWVRESYGSIENAVDDWGWSPGVADGILQTPLHEFMRNDGEHRVCIAAFRRFMDGLIGRIYLDAINDMRSVAPRQLYTYRQGAVGCFDCSYTATHTATDFVCPEGYHLKENEDGYANACFSTEYLRTLSGGQPVLWAEFAKSICGQGLNIFRWDHAKFGPYDEDFETMNTYLNRFHRMVESVHADGVAPWWWCGGFRRTELSDCGYLAPNGELRPCALEYEAVSKRLSSSERRIPTRYITVDRDADARGTHYVCSVVGTEAWHKTESDGEYLGVTLDGEGVDTSSLPMTAVGNVPFTGKNPHKYLDSLFKAARVENGKLCVEFFNTNVATWLASNTYVKLVADGKETLCPIVADTRRLGVAQAELELPSGSVTAVMYTDAVGEFGERYKLDLSDYL